VFTHFGGDGVECHDIKIRMFLLVEESKAFDTKMTQAIRNF